MRLPNGYGSVYKLSGNRRNPWTARKTIGWTFDEKNQKSHPQYLYIGYYKTKKEALAALTAYNENPFDLKLDSITFEEIYERWSDEYYETTAYQNIKKYQAAFRLCEPIHNVRFKDLKYDHLQHIVDISEKHTPTLRNLKALYRFLFEYAAKHEVVTPDRVGIVDYVDIKKAGNPNARQKKRFSAEEVEALWAMAEDENVTIILMLIYSGVRINELLGLKKEDVHLEERYFTVNKSKTAAGVRDVPIAEKVLPFFESWYAKDSKYLLAQKSGKRISYNAFIDGRWNPIIERLGTTTHKPHDARRTCVSLLTEAKVDGRILRKIIGHKGKNVTEDVYTDISLPTKLEAINSI